MAKEKVKSEELKNGNQTVEEPEDEIIIPTGPRKMFRIFVALQGKPPGLMTDPMGQEKLLNDLRARTPVKKPADYPIEKEAADKLYLQDGIVVIPADNLFKTLIIAGRSIKVGRLGKISTQKTTTLPAFLQIEQEFFPLLLPSGEQVNPKAGKDWIPDIRRSVLPSQGIPVCNIRPKFPQWLITLSIKLNGSIHDPSIVRQLFEIAGNMVGLCSFRPNCQGRFGQFKIVGWKEVEIPDDEVAGVDFFEEHPEKLNELQRTTA